MRVYHILQRNYFDAVLWLYLAVCVLVWFAAPNLPWDAVVLRIVANILADTVWIPFGIMLWFLAFSSILKFSFSVSGLLRRYFFIFFSLFSAVIFVMFAYNYAFKLLPLALSLSLINLFYEYFSKQHRPSRKIILQFFLITATFSAYYSQQLLPSFPSESTNTLKVLTYNIYGKAASEDRQLLFETLKQVDADIVCLTEFNPQTDPELFDAALNSLYPYRIANRDKQSWRSGEVILSKYPIRSFMDVFSRDENFVMGEIVIGRKTVTILNIHLTRLVRRAIESGNDMDGLKKGMKESGDIASFKVQQTEKILSLIENTQGPIVLTGDFNDTANSAFYKKISSHLRDTFADAGWGIGGSFGQARLNLLIAEKRKITQLLAHDFLRIDYIFASPELKALSSKVLSNTDGSDHKAVLTVLNVE